MQSLDKHTNAKILSLKGLLCFVVLMMLFPGTALSHAINYAMEKAPDNEVVSFYLKLGFTHIIPDGIDHIVFVIGLCLLSTKFKSILWQATAFTVAHSITLALSMKSIIVLPPAIVEPVIALSIMFIALENLVFKELKPWRILIVFFFGLIHGLGFASALNEIGLPRNKFYVSILSFNGGVELGQIAIITMMFALIIIPLGKKPWYRKIIVNLLSIAIAILAAYWTISRL